MYIALDQNTRNTQMNDFGKYFHATASCPHLTKDMETINRENDEILNKHAAKDREVIENLINADGGQSKNNSH